MNSIKQIEITKKAENYIKAGGLWIFANEFKTKMKDLIPGEWVNFYCQNSFVGHGYVNPHSLIAGRVCSRSQVTDRKLLFEHLLQKRRQSVFQDAVHDIDGGIRLVHAESDQLPGLIIDQYVYKGKKTIVVQSSTAGMDEALEDIIFTINKLLGPHELVVQAESSLRHLEGIKNFTKIIKGKEDDLKSGIVAEQGLLLSADFFEGQKTGFFLDQKLNRLKLRDIISSQYFSKKPNELKVLDLCCYSGGWGLSAMKAGVKNVTFVDQSREALEHVKKAFILNGFEQAQCEFIQADVIEFLDKNKNKYDVIICDPPAFVKSKKNIPQAEKAYFKLNRLAVSKLVIDGLFITCSCSYHLSLQSFIEIIKQAFMENTHIAEVLQFSGQSPDHPWIINRSESFYLKCMFLKGINET